eukprot:5054619-Amphidinium_carterae.1
MLFFASGKPKLTGNHCFVEAAYEGNATPNICSRVGVNGAGRFGGPGLDHETLVAASHRTAWDDWHLGFSPCSPRPGWREPL